MVGVHGVDSAVHDLDNIVQDDKGCLQTGKLDQSLDCSDICLPTTLNLLTSFAQTSQAKVAAALGLETLELGQEDTTDVLLASANTELCRADGLLDLVANSSASNGIADFGEGEGSNLHDSAHLALCIVDTAGDVSETFSQGLTLALEQIVASLSTLQFILHQTQRLPGREHGLSLDSLG